MKLIPAPPHNSREKGTYNGDGSIKRRTRRLLGWSEDGDEILSRLDEGDADDVVTHAIIPALPGYYALESWLNDGEDALLHTKYPVIAWRMESLSSFGNEGYTNTTATPICVAFDICSDQSQLAPILAPDGVVYEDDRDPCEFSDWLTRKLKDHLDAQEKARQARLADKARREKIKSLKGCTDPILFLQAVLVLEGRPKAARILDKLTPARKSARDITPEQHEPIIAACQKTLGITV